MNLLILGGVRFLGKELLKQALEEKHNITLISLDEPDHLDQITWLKVNRENEEELKAALADKTFDCVIDNIAYNGKHVAILLRALKDKVKRYVLTSTIDTYNNEKLKLVDEVSDQNLDHEALEKDDPHWKRYYVGKRDAERVLRSDVSTIEKVILRPCIVSGAYDNVPGKIKGFGRSLVLPARVSDNQPVLIYENDHELFSLVYVGDVAKALLLAAKHPNAADQVFNISGDTIWNTESYIKKIIEVSGSTSKVIKVVQGQLNDSGIWNDFEDKHYLLRSYGRSSVHRYQLFDNSRLKALGWKPTKDKDAIKSLFDHPDLLANAREKITDYRRREIEYANQLKLIDSKEDYLPGHCTDPLSRIAIGTHRGDTSDETNATYYNAIAKSILNGINVVDVAINYRGTQSEKVVGQVINDLVSSGVKERNDIYVITKGGFTGKEYQWRLINEHEKQYKSSIRPAFIKHCFEHSYNNLKLGTIDLYLLHNSEIALNYMTHDEYYYSLLQNFINLEEEVAKGRLRGYGLATWPGLRVKRDEKLFIDMNRVLEMAEIAARGRNSQHHFVGVELPININRNEAVTLPNQYHNGALVTAVEYAKHHNLKLFISNSAMYGESNENIESFYNFDYGLTSAQKSLLFVKSIPEVTSAIVGMKQSAHVDQAIEVNNHFLLSEREVSSIIKKCVFKKLSN